MLDLMSLENARFDAVICMDNSLPHLDSTEHLLHAAEQIRSRLRPGGCLMASIRDYDQLIEQRPVVLEPAFYSDQGRRRIVFQVWEWIDARRYIFHLYITRELANGWQTFHTTGLYRAIRSDELGRILSQAGLKNPRWLAPGESGFYQPIVLAEAG
jgi:SAM-dependent methyltransferase